ncbi:MAG: Rpn family recombination-promoting nuclease/putative transposase [Flavobacterium sp.]|nr:Rpn family recombination-promoting nuclease/putative transposase [Flavobacterium sp.]
MKTDKAWKSIIDGLFRQFVEFFMSEIYDLIDFSVEPKSLDNEFKALFPESESDDRRVDKLFEVKLKNNDIKWILLHIEVQSYKDKDFAKRMYHYYSRIFDKYDKEIEAIAVYTYKSDLYKYNEYKQELRTTKLIYQYKIYDIAIQDIKELKKSTNPFSFAIQTLIKAFGYEESDQKNFNFKLELTKLLLGSGFSNDEINNLFTFINHVFEIKNKNLRNEFYEEAKGMALSNRSYDFTDYDMVVVEKRDKEIAINMLKKGSKVEFISDVTGLTISEVEELKKSIK